LKQSFSQPPRRQAKPHYGPKATIGTYMIDTSALSDEHVISRIVKLIDAIDDKLDIEKLI
jgi:hypothetical protein